MATRLPEREFDERLASVRERIEASDADAGVWFDATSIEYLTGFTHVQTERPVVLGLTPERCEMVVPRLEVERVEDNPRIDAVHGYFDYPGGVPIETAARMLREMGADSVAADAEGAPGTMGYEGPALSAFLDVETESWVDRMRWAKSDPETELIRESVRWANLGHRYLADFAEPGAHPVTVSQTASMEGSRAMLDTLGDRYVPRTRGDGPVHAGFISGEQTALPHGHTANRYLEDGDVPITGASANVDGYRSELERTMWGYFEEQGVADLARHHVGHNIGLGAHEPPYIDRGWSDHCESDATDYDEGDAVMRPGHVYTIEPGLYTEETGYRHSDTVAITEDGVEVLTYFPRDLGANVVG